jgi:hypothetical protein
MSTIIELAVELAIDFVGAIIESSLISLSPKSRVEKIYEKLESFQEKRVVVHLGTVLPGGKFQVDETIEVPVFNAKLTESNLFLYLSENAPPTCISGKTLSRFYTGKKSNTRICINTEHTDYLLDLILN